MGRHSNMWSGAGSRRFRAAPTMAGFRARRLGKGHGSHAKTFEEEGAEGTIEIEESCGEAERRALGEESSSDEGEEGSVEERRVEERRVEERRVEERRVEERRVEERRIDCRH